MAKIEDLGDMKTLLMSLHSSLLDSKHISTQKVIQIKDKITDLNRKVDQKKNQLLNQKEVIKLAIKDISRLEERSLSVKDSVHKINSKTTEDREFIENLTKKFDLQKENNSVVESDTLSQMNGLSQLMIKLAIDSNSKLETQIQIKEEFKDEIEELDQQIKGLSTELESINKDLNQLNDGSEQLSVVSDEDLETELDIKWTDWPIRDRIIAIDIFRKGKQLLSEDLEFLNHMSEDSDIN